MADLRIALIAVADLRGVDELAHQLAGAGYTIVAAGATAQHLSAAGVAVLPAEQLTGVPEILDGRVQTLHPAVHGGIVARRDRPEHLETLQNYNVAPIDIVVANLLPLEHLFAQREAAGWPAGSELDGVDVAAAAVLRSAAGNFNDVLTLVDPDDYAAAVAELLGGRLDVTQRRALAAKAFAHLAAQDNATAVFLGGEAAGLVGQSAIPGGLRLDLGVPEPLAESENSHQATWHHTDPQALLAGSPLELQEHARTLPYAQQLDGDLAWRTVCDLPSDLACAVLTRNGNPIGAAGLTTSVAGALLRAMDGDPGAIGGAVLAVNRPFDLGAARALGDRPIGLLLAPWFDEEAIEVLAAKPHLRLLALGELAGDAVRHVVHVTQFGVLLRTLDVAPLALDTAVVVTKAKPTPAERKALELAWRVAKHVRSNAVVIADENGTVGIGAGQVTRGDAAMIATGKCRKGYKPLAAACDGPLFGPEALEPLMKSGLRAIVQPGGSPRDAEIAAAADTLGLALLLTGVTHYRY